MMDDLESVCNEVDNLADAAKKDGVDNLVISAVLIKKAGELLYEHCGYDVAEYELMLNANIIALRKYLTRDKKDNGNVEV